MRLLSVAGLAITVLLASGCVATAPIKVARTAVNSVSKATDWATTSGDEADRERGRTLRKKCKERYDPYYCEK